MVALENGNLVLIGGHGHGYDVTMFDFGLEEWVVLPNIAFHSDRYDFLQKVLMSTKFKSLFKGNIEGSTEVEGHG